MAAALKTAAVALCVVLALSSMAPSAMGQVDCNALCTAACSCTGTCRPCIENASCIGVCNPTSTFFPVCQLCKDTAKQTCVTECVTGCTVP